METKIYEPTSENIKKIAELIKNDELVAFPTETVYGLGANALSTKAVEKIFEVKNRPADNPLIVHVCSPLQIMRVAMEFPEKARLLADHFMPGPLTIVLEKKPILSDLVTGGLNTVGVRMPDHPVALEFINACNLPVCAPSANLSTRPSPTIARHVFDDMNGRIPAILDGGQCDFGIESTIVDVTGKVPVVLRKGAISIEELRAVVGEVKEATGEIHAPGNRYKHYAPKAEVLLSAYYDEMHVSICEKYDELVAACKKPVILCLNYRAEMYGDREIMEVGKDYAEYAHNLFAFLRYADERGYDTVIAEGVKNEGIGESLINRLIKSSGGQVI